ncbi:MAG: hypothetical protein CMM31_08980 [Rhodospirillaceae bacterium]|nr:hypothetical protein [Rhodospirillaceae bacterium]
MELAAKFDAELHLVQVVGHVHASSCTAEFAKAEKAGDPDLVEIDVVQNNLAHKYQAKAHKAGVATFNTSVARGDPAEELLNYADACSTAW